MKKLFYSIRKILWYVMLTHIAKKAACFQRAPIQRFSVEFSKVIYSAISFGTLSDLSVSVACENIWFFRLYFHPLEPKKPDALASYSHCTSRTNRWFSRDVIAAMLVDDNKRSLISFFCSSTRRRTFLYCY